MLRDGSVCLYFVSFVVELFVVFGKVFFFGVFLGGGEGIEVNIFVLFFCVDKFGVNWVS